MKNVIFCKIPTKYHYYFRSEIPPKDLLSFSDTKYHYHCRSNIPPTDLLSFLIQNTIISLDLKFLQQIYYHSLIFRHIISAGKYSATLEIVKNSLIPSLIMAKHLHNFTQEFKS